MSADGRRRRLCHPRDMGRTLPLLSPPPRCTLDLSKAAPHADSNVKREGPPLTAAGVFRGPAPCAPGLRPGSRDSNRRVYHTRGLLLYSNYHVGKSPQQAPGPPPRRKQRPANTHTRSRIRRRRRTRKRRSKQHEGNRRKSPPIVAKNSGLSRGKVGSKTGINPTIPARIPLAGGKRK